MLKRPKTAEYIDPDENEPSPEPEPEVEPPKPRIRMVQGPYNKFPQNLDNLKLGPKEAKPRNLLRTLARQYTGEAIQALVDICTAKGGNHMARVHAANALLDRGWGKPHLLQEMKESQPLTKIKVSFEGGPPESVTIDHQDNADPADEPSDEPEIEFDLGDSDSDSDDAADPDKT